MARQTIQVDSIAYLVAPDDPPPVGGRLSVLAQLRLSDELTGRAPAARVTVTTDVPHAVPKVADGGLIAIVGVPRDAFPRLAVQNYTARITVVVDGFIPRTVAIAVPQAPAFPGALTPPPLIELALHRPPTVIRGRVVQRVGGNTVAVAGAVVAWKGIWRTPPPANVAVASSPPDLVSLAPGLYHDRAAATGQLAPVTLTAVLGADKTTLDHVPAGASPVRLSDRAGVGPGDVLVLDATDPDRAEYLTIATVTGASTADQPAWFTFTAPPARPHRRGATVRKITPAPAGPATAFAADGWSGDACAFLASVAGLPASGFVRVSGGPAPDGFHAARTFTATSDADGYYRLPPLARVAQVQATAIQGALKADVTFRPDVSLDENVLVFLIK